MPVRLASCRSRSDFWGRPEIERDGVVVEAPRGHKSWAVPAYVLLSGPRVSRARLASLMFAGADDPLGALRWTLAQLRRALGAPGALQGDPLELGVEASVDVFELAGAQPGAALASHALVFNAFERVRGAAAPR